jgi:large conductance mechanosensitive channel
VNDLIMPPLGLLLAQVDFRELKVVLKASPPAVTLNYGAFVSAVLDFLIVGFALFLVVKGINRMHRKPPSPPPDTRECPHCCSAIPLRATRCGHCTSPLNP